MKDPKKGKHSHNNRESKEGQILKFIREFRKYSQEDIGKKINLRAIEIDHFENGRKFYTQSDIELFLKAYDVSNKEFETMLNYKIVNRAMINAILIQQIRPS